MPVVQLLPPSVLYWVEATPLPASLGVRVTVTGVFDQALSLPEAVVTGGVVSMLTVQVLAVSVLPAASVERYWMGWLPSLAPPAGAGIVTELPVVQLLPPSVLYWVVGWPLPASVAAKLTVTGVLCQALSAPVWVVTGAVASIFTLQLLAISWLPAASVERYWMVCAPSLEPLAGAGICTEAPVVQVPPSTLYWVEPAPLPASVSVKLTVTALLCQLPSAPDWVVTGGVVSMCTVYVAGFVLPKPLVSTARTWKYQMPSALPVNEAARVDDAGRKYSLPSSTLTVPLVWLVAARSV